MIFANAASQKGGGGMRGRGVGVANWCEYLIIYVGPKPTDEQSIEGLKV